MIEGVYKENDFSNTQNAVAVTAELAKKNEIFFFRGNV